ncbi:MAG: chemotaxis protein CheW [Alphaproteobacteria bacterium]|nr:chemotaxis protein CheW [Alphaproteobacteria bacterium]
MSEQIVAAGTAMIDGDTDQFVMMQVGNQDIAFAIQDVRDAVEPHAITPIPLAPSAIAGVMNLRGRIVTVIDLRRILGGEDDGGENGREYSHMTGITVDRPEGPFTLLVDSVSEVRRIERSLLEAPPVTLDPALKRLCMGVFQLPGRLVVLLDVDRILEPETILATPTIPFQPRRKAPMIEDRQRNRVAVIEPPGAPAIAELEPYEVPLPPARAAEDVLNPAIAIAHRTTGGWNENPKVGAPAISDVSKSITSAPPQRAALPILDGIGGKAALSKLVIAVYEEILGDPLLADLFVGADMPMQRERMVTALENLLSTSGSNFASAAIGFDWLVPEKVMEDEHFNLCLGHFERVLGRLAVEKTLAERFLTAIEWCREGVVD